MNRETVAKIVGCEFVREPDEVLVSGVEAEVCIEIARRQQFGLAKYGTTVEANPLSLMQWVQHAKEEALDLAVYLTKIERMLRKLEDDGK